MTALEKYGWWGSGSKEPPADLKTKKQLSELGLRPLKPVGLIQTSKYDCLLYDPKDPASAAPKRKCSDKQLEILARNRDLTAKKAAYKRWCREGGWIESDRVQAVEWAREMMQRQDWVILDTETTGLYAAEVVEIAVIAPQGNPLLDTLVKPTITIPEEVIKIHGITNEMVAEAPSFVDVHSQIVAALFGKQVIIYNADFDIGILKYCCQLHRLPLLGLRERSHCLMEWHSQWVGEWREYFRSYRWQPLCGGHRALSDCRAALSCLQSIAADTPHMCYPKGIEPP